MAIDSEHATQARIALEEWLAYADRLGRQGVEIDIGNADGGQRGRYPQRVFAAVKAHGNDVRISLAKKGTEEANGPSRTEPV